MESKREQSQDIPKTVLEDCVKFIGYAIRSLLRDEFNNCFEEKRPNTSKRGKKDVILYLLGWIFRYFVIFPLRVLFLVLTLGFLFVLFFTDYLLLGGRFAVRILSVFFKLLLFSFGVYVRHHGTKPNFQIPHLFVSNHTSFIDFIVLSSRYKPHSTIMQRHRGFLGFISRNFLMRGGSKMFDRKEKVQRYRTKELIKILCRNVKAPLLVFPEGTCVNNEFTVLFQKGAFIAGVPVCPVAIKYSKKYSDPYWNTRKQGFITHILYLMSRWSLWVDVYWLGVRTPSLGETTDRFTKRIKNEISKAAGLKNLDWNGYLKNCIISAEELKLLNGQQEKYTEILKNRYKGIVKKGPGSRNNEEVEIVQRNRMMAEFELNDVVSSMYLLRETIRENFLLMKLIEKSG